MGVFDRKPGKSDVEQTQVANPAQYEFAKLLLQRLAQGGGSYTRGRGGMDTSAFARVLGQPGALDRTVRQTGTTTPPGASMFEQGAQGIAVLALLDQLLRGEDNKGGLAEGAGDLFRMIANVYQGTAADSLTNFTGAEGYDPYIDMFGGAPSPTFDDIAWDPPPADYVTAPPPDTGNWWNW